MMILPNGVLSFQAEEEARGEVFDIVDTEHVILGPVRGQVTWNRVGDMVSMVSMARMLPWSRTTRYQITANTSHDIRKEAAKLRIVQDHGAPIIEVKKSLRYLEMEIHQENSNE